MTAFSLFFTTSVGFLWAQQQVGQDIYGSENGDHLGTSVSLSADGTIMAIGAPSSGTGYVRVYYNLSGVWTQIGDDIEGENGSSQSGTSVSLSADGTAVAIGSPDDVENGYQSGQVRVYRNLSGLGTWTQVGEDINGAVQYHLGSSVSLSKDSKVLAIGAEYANGLTGLVRVYREVSGVWTQIGEDINGEAGGDYSGSSVSLSSAGDMVAIGAHLNDGNGSNSGHVRVYRNESDTWTKVGQDIDGEAGDFLGTSVSLSSDGTIVAMGATGNTLASGHVRVYRLESNVWRQIGEDIEGETAMEQLGVSVSLNSSGTVVAIGSGKNIGNRGNVGDVQVYQNALDTWVKVGRDIEGLAAFDNAGNSVSLSADGGTVAVGIKGSDRNPREVGHNDGRVNVYAFQVMSISADVTSVVEDTDATFTLTRGEDNTGALSVNVVVTQDGDVTTNTGSKTVTFAANEATAKLSVAPEDDDIDEVGGSIIATIEGGAIIGNPISAAVTVRDNDLPIITITADASVKEGDAISYTLTRAGVLTQSLTASATVTQIGNVTGDAGTYTVTFAPDEATATFDVPTLENAVAEDLNRGSIVATIEPRASLYRVGDPNVATVTVEDDDLLVITIAGGPSVIEGTAATFTLTRTGVVTGTLRVNVKVTQDGDFTTDTGTKTVVFPPGSLTAPLAVTTIDDDGGEPHGSITATVKRDGSAYRVGDPSVATVTVNDNDLPVVTIVGGASVTEGTDAIFTLSRAEVTRGTLDVNVAVTQDGDVTAHTGDATATFAAYAITTTFTVTTDNDDNDEVDGSVIVTIANSDLTYRLGDPNTATVAVADDDLPLVTIAGGSSVTEGEDVTFTLTREGVVTDALSVNVEVTQSEDATAETGSRTVEFAASSSTATLTLGTLPDDDNDEADGGVIVTVTTDGSVYRVGDPSVATVVVEDDDLPIITISGGSSVTEGTSAIFTLTRVGDITKSLNVSIELTQDGDFTDEVGSKTVEFAASLSTITFAVATISDDDDESDGGVIAIVSADESAYRLGDPATATVTVIDDDLPVITIFATLASIPEGDAASFFLTRSGELAQSLSVEVLVTQLGDVTANTGIAMVTFVADASRATFTVPTLDNEVDEELNRGSITATIESSTTYILGDPIAATVMVKDDDLWAESIGSSTGIVGEFPGDGSGGSVSISSDGTIVAIGATFNAENGINSGHVRVYGNESGTWTQIGQDIDGKGGHDMSGGSVSINSDGTVLAIGATGNDGNGNNSGHVRVYRNESGTWTQIGGDIYGEAANDRSGGSVSLSSDGTVLAIGATGNDGNGANAGHVRVYRNESDAWVQIGENIDGESPGDGSGVSVSLSSDGTVLAIGADLNDGNGDNSGHVRVYRNESDSWVQVGQDIDGEEAKDYSGGSVSISSDGTVLAVGAYWNDGNGIDAGHVRVYRYESGAWVQLGQDIDGEASGDWSGGSVSLDSDGTTLAVGARHNDANGVDAGHVRVYRYESDMWVQLRQDIYGEASGDWSGGSVSISSDGKVLAIGAEGNDGNGSNSGHVRVYDITLPDVTITMSDPLTITEGESITFTLARAGITTEALSVDVVVSQDGDFTSESELGVAEFASGSSTAVFTITTDDDDNDEADGSITVTIVDGGLVYRLGDPSSATVTVADNDLPIVTIAADAASVTEGTDATFTLTRVGITKGTLMVNVEVTQDGNVTTGMGSKTVEFAADVATATLTVATVPDNDDEVDGSVIATVTTDGSTYRVNDLSVASATVEDDDLSVVTIVSEISTIEGTDAVFTLTRVGVITDILSVDVDVTQIGGYVEANATGTQTVVFAHRESTAVLVIATIDDELNKVDGSVMVTIEEDGTRYIVGTPSSAEITVTDDDRVLVGLQDEEDEGLLYPNPMGDWLNVRISEAGRYQTLTVYTPSGRRERIYRVKPGQRTASLDVSGLASGLYVIALTGASGQSTYYRVVKE